MRVLILGAGVSKPAGYPLASELLDDLADVARRTPFSQLRNAWQRWEGFRDDLPSQLRLAAYNSNPEVVLTLVDLFIAAIEVEDLRQTSSAVRTFRETGEADTAALDIYYNSPERKALRVASAARARLLDVLEWYFWFKHHEDGQRAGQERRQYLHELIEPLSDGDVIITLNWDTLAERTLAEEGKWNPQAGYGFERMLMVERGVGRRVDLPPEYPAESPVQVLKLHGSFGWRRTDFGVYLDSNMLLRDFDFHFDGERIRLVDSAEPESFRDDPPLIAYPSFLKQLDHPIVDRVWRNASEALAHADSVEVWGYSLPASDGAIRALLQGVSTRVRRGELSVVVRDPSQSVLARWKALLSERIEARREQL